MIFFYSATGNSRFAALRLAELLNTKTVDIVNTAPESARIEEGETIGFVFPIYCWGVPPVVTRFIEAICDELKKARYVWGLCTCGDEAGIAMRLFNRHIKTLCGKDADALFSLLMPNTYVLLPGFDVDKKNVEKRKLTEAPERLKYIASVIETHPSGVYDVHQGSVATLRTRLLFPIFKKWGVFPKKWHISDACISCGKCSRICPARNIEMKNGKPSWGTNCYSCCACYHVCPVHSVAYGRITLKKSQYLCPSLSLMMENQAKREEGD